MPQHRSKTLAATATALAAGIPLTVSQAAFGGPASASSSAAQRMVVDAVRAASVTGHPVAAGPAASARQTFLVTLKDRNPAGLAALARAVNSPGNSRFRHFLTPAEYTSKFAPTAAEASAAAHWLRTQGLTIVGRDPQNAYLQVRGSTAAIDRTFATRLGTYRSDGHQFTAPAKNVTVPAPVGNLIAGVAGLDTVPLQTQHEFPGPTLAQAETELARNGSEAAAAQLRRIPASLLDQTPALAGGCSQFYGQAQSPDLPPGNVGPSEGTSVPRVGCGYTPDQVDTALGINKGDTTGKGVTVGIVLWCDYPTTTSDLARWATLVGAGPFGSGQYSVVPPVGGYNETYCSGLADADTGIEQALDVEAIHGAAPGAKIIYAPGSDGTFGSLVLAMHALVDPHLVDVMTNSYGAFESTVDSGDMQAVDAVLQQAAAEGITVLAASGDYGDNSANPLNPTHSPNPLFPASDPWVTAVGGTAIGLSSSSRVRWVAPWFTAGTAERNDSWGDSFTLTGAGGGGTSQDFAEPWYQDGVVPSSLTGTPADRVIPDLANLAAPDTGYLIGSTAITNAVDIPTNNIALQTIGGTSVASPLTAAQIADAIQRNGGQAIGFLNPVIYSADGSGLEDLSDNNPSYSSALSADIAPIAEASVEMVEGGQSLVKQTLSVAPGYDNLSGLGAVTSQSAFARMLTR